MVHIVETGPLIQLSTNHRLSAFLPLMSAHLLTQTSIMPSIISFIPFLIPVPLCSKNVHIIFLTHSRIREMARDRHLYTRGN